jgi:Family of unknown function (DUF5336)
MTYSTGPGGYGGAGQGPSQSYSTQPSGYTAPTQAFGAVPTPAQAPSETPGQGTQTPGQGKSLPFFLNIAVAALGAINFLLGGFAETFFLPGLALLLGAGAIAALAMLPKQTSLDVAVAGLTIAGFLSLLFAFVGPDNGLISASLGYILLLFLAFAQSAIAVAVLLFSADIIKPPQPKPKQQSYGYYGQGGYGQPGGYGQVSQAPQAQPQQPYYGGGAGQTYQPPSPPQQQHQPQQPGQSQPPQQQW